MLSLRFGFLVHLLAALAGATAFSADGLRVPLDSIVRQHEVDSRVEGVDNVILRKNRFSLVLNKNSRKIYISGMLAYMDSSFLQAQGRWTLHRSDARTLLNPILGGPVSVKPPGGVVVLDPGHGGQDDGAKHGSTLEKELVLDIARRTSAVLKKHNISHRLTRESDEALDLSERTDFARKAGAGLFVSIHCNSSSNPNAKGSETYVLPAAGFPSTSGNGSELIACAGNRFDPLNTLLGCHVQRQLLISAHCSDRGLKKARFQVLREAPCPAALVECGFISNASERRNLESADYRQRLAKGLANGIMNYWRSTRK